MKPRLFIGSSVEGLNIARGLRKNLARVAEVTVWNEGIFSPSQTTLESLLEVLTSSDFAVFIFSPDDIAQIRGNSNIAVRDNVIFELGLFIGRLGKNRCYFIKPNNCKDLHLPTDLLGITPAQYEADRSDGNMQSATSDASFEIQGMIEKLGFLPGGNQVAGDESGQQLEMAKDYFSITKSTVRDSVQSNYQEAFQSESINSSVVASNSADPANLNVDKVNIKDGWFEAFKNKDYEQAIKLLNENLKKSDGEEAFSIQCRIGVCEYFIDAPKGKAILEKLIEENSNKARVYSALAYAYQLNDLHDDALCVVEKGIGSAEDKDALFLMKSRILKDIGRIDDAISSLLEGIERCPASPNLYIALIDICLDKKDDPQTYDIFTKALKTFPNNVDLLYKYGLFLDVKGRRADALYVFERLVSIKPTSPSYLAYLGNQCMELNLFDKALTIYEKADKYATNDKSWILANVGNLYRFRGFYTKGLECLQQSLALYSDSQYCHDRYATGLNQQKSEEDKYQYFVQMGRTNFLKPVKANE